MPRGTRQLPKECLRRLGEAELILHGGDLVGAPVLEALGSLAPVEAVAGNMDQPELLAILPERRVVEVGGARIAMIHDAGPKANRLARMRARFKDADAVVFGHSHLPLHEIADDGFQIFNPGSPTERRGAPAHTMGIATLKAGRPHFELIAL